MRTSTLLPRLIAVLGTGAICIGATSSSCSTSTDTGGTGGDDPDFVAELALQDSTGRVTDTFQRGELIQMVLTVRNRTNATRTVNFTTSRQADFVVVREGTTTVVWKLSEVQAAPSSTPTSLDFAAGQARTFNTTWTQEDSGGSRVRTGAYEARGVLVFDGFDSHPLRASQLGSTPRPFTIN